MTDGDDAVVDDVCVYDDNIIVAIIVQYYENIC